MSTFANKFRSKEELEIAKLQAENTALDKRIAGFEAAIMKGAPGLDYFGVKELKDGMRTALNDKVKNERKIQRLRDKMDLMAVK